MAAGLGALGHHEVAARLDGAHGVVDLAAHVDHQHVGAVALLDDLGGDAQRGHEGGGAAVDDDLHLLRHAAGHGGEQIHRERLVGGLAHGGDLGLHDGAAHGARTEATETARLRDGGHQSEYETPPMPANMTGCSMPSSSVRRVRMGALALLVSIRHGLRPASAAGTVARAALGRRREFRRIRGGRLPLVAF